MPKLSGLSAAEKVEKWENILIVDSKGNLVRMTAEKAATRLIGTVNPDVSHRTVWRGKNLGSSFTAAQKAAIKDGTFDDLFVGDYWSIADNYWRIMDIDYFTRAGEPNSVNGDHHLVIVPDRVLTTAAMHSSTDLSKGYMGTTMYSTTLPGCLTTINNAFGSAYIYERSDRLCNSSSSGKENGSAWAKRKVDLMSELYVYGSPSMRNSQAGMLSYGQFAGFRLRPSLIIGDNKAGTSRSKYWLRDIATATSCCLVYDTGNSNYESATSSSVGVRPFFLLKGA